MQATWTHASAGDSACRRTDSACDFHVLACISYHKRAGQPRNMCSSCSQSATTRAATCLPHCSPSLPRVYCAPPHAFPSACPTGCRLYRASTVLNHMPSHTRACEGCSAKRQPCPVASWWPTCQSGTMCIRRLGRSTFALGHAFAVELATVRQLLARGSVYSGQPIRRERRHKRRPCG